MVNMSLYLGIRLRGALGAITAILGLVGLPILVVIAMPRSMRGSTRLRTLHLVLDGVAAAAVGMNIATGVKAARRSTTLVPGAIAAAVFVAVGIFHWPIARRRRLHRPAQHLPRPPAQLKALARNPGERAA